jgi:hypothetical protein
MNTRFAAIFLTIAFLPLSAFAQHNRAEVRARQHDRRAAQHFQRWEYEEALSELQEAQRIAPSPSRLYNMARSEEALGNNNQAVRLYQEYLDSGDTQPSRQRLAQEAIARLQASNRRRRPTTSRFAMSFGLGVLTVDVPEAQYYITAHAPADSSPCPSWIHLDQSDSGATMSIDLSFDFDLTNMFNLETGPVQIVLFAEIIISPTFKTFLVWSLAAGARADFYIFRRLYLSIGLGLGVAGATGRIGEVGERTEGCSDIYLEAPDGHRYYIGSEVVVSDASFQFHGKLGIGYLFSPHVRLHLELGGQLVPELDDWTYRVTDNEDDSISVDLPSSGFDEHPPSVRLSGFLGRLVFTYLF